MTSSLHAVGVYAGEGFEDLPKRTEASTGDDVGASTPSRAESFWTVWWRAVGVAVRCRKFLRGRAQPGYKFSGFSPRRACTE